MTSNEAFIALPDGDVTRTRAVARLVPSQRWNKHAILAIKGVPSRPRPKNPADDSVIESYRNPHLNLDAELRQKLEQEDESAADMPLCLHDGRKLPSLRITRSDLERYGPTIGCPRCLDIGLGIFSTGASHNE